MIPGNFSSIGGTSAANVASYSPSSDSFTALGTNGPDGAVHSLFCDDSNNNVWAGGKFASPSPSVAIWNTKSSSWSPPPFGVPRSVLATIRNHLLVKLLDATKPPTIPASTLTSSSSTESDLEDEDYAISQEEADRFLSYLAGLAKVRQGVNSSDVK